MLVCCVKFIFAFNLVSVYVIYSVKTKKYNFDKRKFIFLSIVKWSVDMLDVFMLMYRINRWVYSLFELFIKISYWISIWNIVFDDLTSIIFWKCKLSSNSKFWTKMASLLIWTSIFRVTYLLSYYIFRKFGIKFFNLCIGFFFPRTFRTSFVPWFACSLAGQEQKSNSV